MNAQQLASQLHGRDIRQEMTEEEKYIAEQNNLVVAYGYSDEYLVMKGVVRDWTSAWEGATVYLTGKGLVTNLCDCDNCPYHKEQIERAKPLSIVWNGFGPIAWNFETSIPHHTFDIMEDGDVWCRGIVFSLDDVEES